ncbi:unnamed protein product, partial [Rotaria magnacalcarata]
MSLLYIRCERDQKISDNGSISNNDNGESDAEQEPTSTPPPPPPPEPVSRP